MATPVEYMVLGNIIASVIGASIGFIGNRITISGLKKRIKESGEKIEDLTKKLISHDKEMKRLDDVVSNAGSRPVSNVSTPFENENRVQMRTYYNKQTGEIEYVNRDPIN
jgi:predicted RNase H-like nuclease (RuvC/YqgF family)